MAILEALYSERDKLMNDLEKINSLINQIDKSIQSLDLAVSKINEYYLVNDVAYDNGKIKEISDNLGGANGTLAKIVSEINEKIVLVNKAIEDELQRLAAEEEARQQELSSL